MPLPALPIHYPPAIEIEYIGGPTTVIRIDGVSFITDPTFDAPGSYQAGAVTLTKTRGPAATEEALGPIDVALVSHDQHPDNLDQSGRELLRRVPHVLTTVAGAQRLGHGATGLEAWETLTVRTPTGHALTITATPARHGPAGIEKITGDVIGFVISDGPNDLVYVTGDTVWYAGTAEVARRFRPGVVLLFAGAAQTRGPFHLTMDTNDAVEAATAFPNATLVPVHHEGWAHFSQSKGDLEKVFEIVGLSHRLKLLREGEAWRLEPSPQGAPLDSIYIPIRGLRQ